MNSCALLIGDLEREDGTVVTGHTFARTEQIVWENDRPYFWAPAVTGNGLVRRAIFSDSAGCWHDHMRPGDLPFVVTGADFYIPAWKPTLTLAALLWGTP